MAKPVETLLSSEMACLGGVTLLNTTAESTAEHSISSFGLPNKHRNRESSFQENGLRITRANASHREGAAGRKIAYHVALSQEAQPTLASPMALRGNSVPPRCRM